MSYNNSSNPSPDASRLEYDLSNDAYPSSGRASFIENNEPSFENYTLPTTRSTDETNENSYTEYNYIPDSFNVASTNLIDPEVLASFIRNGGRSQGAYSFASSVDQVSNSVVSQVVNDSVSLVDSNSPIRAGNLSFFNDSSEFENSPAARVPIETQRFDQKANDLSSLVGNSGSAAGQSVFSNSATLGVSSYSATAATSASAGTGVISDASSNVFVSGIEQAILRSTAPIDITESEEITVLGQRGIWANRAEVVNWRGAVPISEYQINEDANTEIVTKRVNQQLEYVQELAIRYLRPPTPPPPGEIVIVQQGNTLTPPAPPLVIRQQPPRPDTPEPLVVREAPPQPPASVGRKVITISGRRLPPPPRKVVIERLAPLPAKPQSVLVERWLPYSQVKRRVVFQRPATADPVVVRPRNVIVQWEAPSVNIRKEVKYLGVVRANPAEYVQRYGASLRVARDLPQFVSDIKTPDGLVLAADYVYNSVHELEGDLQAFRLVDLEREGLGEYKTQLLRLGINFSSSAGPNSASIFDTSSSSSGVTTFLSSSGAPNTVGLAATSSAQFSASVNEVFTQLDRDSNGSISVDEARRAFLLLNSRLGRSYGENEVVAFFTALDKDRSGNLSLAEFRAACEKLK